jgi:hypothetical protein
MGTPTPDEKRSRWTSHGIGNRESKSFVYIELALLPREDDPFTSLANLPESLEAGVRRQ